MRNMEILYDVYYGYYDGDELTETFETYLAAIIFIKEYVEKQDYDFKILRKIEIDERGCEEITILKEY